MDRFDAIRAANPDLAISLYALTPGGSVTLEVISGEQSWTWVGETGEAAMEMAFPLETPEPPAVSAALAAGGMEGWDHIEDRMSDALKAVSAKPEPVTVSSPAPSIFD